ncbi:3-methyl-2-oxobutanoate dehydrogenase subunit VorB [Candidatus Aerophobetes bacterium]|nr:3-methyl-2-oxobutanoate dehydrogenase subunit VorB [Candidatus Aerophobetes bacterium]
MKKVLLSGNEAIAEGAVRAGCRGYFGYPITPQSEICAYMAKRLEEVGGVFLQAESEIAAINMVYGAAAAGMRAMTSSSGPGISLKQEGISYLAGAQLPALIVNVMRGGPGLGNIAPSQSDYFQATKGGGHGDYHLIVLAPSSVQDMADFPLLAFELADNYRNPVMILTDAILAQMMEQVSFGKMPCCKMKAKPWAITGAKGRTPNIIRSLFLQEGVLEAHNKVLQKKYKKMKEKEIRYKLFGDSNPEILLVAYGSMFRVCMWVVQELKKMGKSCALLRPVTLWPFPYQIVAELAKEVTFIFVVEMSEGQMLEDVRLGCEGASPVYFYGRMGGGVPEPEEVLRKVKEVLES